MTERTPTYILQVFEICSSSVDWKCVIIVSSTINNPCHASPCPEVLRNAFCHVIVSGQVAMF
jgi:hypothetical protein